eukprot:scaffold4845_cov51-Attheya_sp.AAC.4
MEMMGSRTSSQSSLMSLSSSRRSGRVTRGISPKPPSRASRTTKKRARAAGPVRKWVKLSRVLPGAHFAVPTWALQSDLTPQELEFLETQSKTMEEAIIDANSDIPVAPKQSTQTGEHATVQPSVVTTAPSGDQVTQAKHDETEHPTTQPSVNVSQSETKPPGTHAQRNLPVGEEFKPNEQELGSDVTLDKKQLSTETTAMDLDQTEEETTEESEREHKRPKLS